MFVMVGSPVDVCVEFEYVSLVLQNTDIFSHEGECVVAVVEVAA